MRTEDHYLLAKQMITHQNISKGKRTAFLFGNIEPDYNRFSYLGKNKEHFSLGHSYECRKTEIFEFLEKPYQDNWLWWYRAGKAFHYLTDSFSRPHNPEFGYKSAAHVKYEWHLHDIVQRAIRSNPWKIPVIEGDLDVWVELRHDHYMERTKGIQDDCYYIYTTLMAVWNWVVATKL